MLGSAAGYLVFTLPNAANVAFNDYQISSLIAERIILAESQGCATVTNKRSTATGPAQFIEGTWLSLIRKHRPDLAKKDKEEILALRKDYTLSREMAVRYAQQSAKVLERHGFPVTPSTLYLSHFAGRAGAMAILSAQDTENAALVMAKADSTGRVTREQLVRANPFLENFNIADLKKWSERKMRKRQKAKSKKNGSCSA
jgi:hypothetical protein